MKNNKGFTLIELIAVVVIMAIIALLATPNVINLLQTGKKEEMVADAKEFISKASYMYRSEKFNNGSGTGSYRIDEIKGVNQDDLIGPWGKEYSGQVVIQKANGKLEYKISLTTQDENYTYRLEGSRNDIDAEAIEQNKK